jgi:hypothetical protein
MGAKFGQQNITMFLRSVLIYSHRHTNVCLQTAPHVPLLSASCDELTRKARKAAARLAAEAEVEVVQVEVDVECSSRPPQKAEARQASRRLRYPSKSPGTRRHKSSRRWNPVPSSSAAMNVGGGAAVEPADEEARSPSPLVLLPPSPLPNNDINGGGDIAEAAAAERDGPVEGRAATPQPPRPSSPAPSLTTYPVASPVNDDGTTRGGGGRFGGGGGDEEDEEGAVTIRAEPVVIVGMSPQRRVRVGGALFLLLAAAGTKRTRRGR